MTDMLWSSAGAVPVVGIVLLFFFSSRRRHTRCSRDWSSDVCSSDLWLEGAGFRKVGQNVKFDCHVLANQGLRLAGCVHDTQIGRASCRERVEISEGAGASIKKEHQT